MQNFEEIGLSSEILKAITELGFEKPTPIQAKTIPHLLSSENDLVALAQTGTGKTAAFGLPIIQQIDPKMSATQALILCPTRELCMQITRDIENYSKYMDNFKVVPVYGGTSIDTQIRALSRGSQIVVGTPGRTLDLIRRKRLKISNIKWLILDEADEMLSMGFKDDLDTILVETPQTKQTLLFSATMPKEIARIAAKYMNNAEEISAGKRNIGAENVNHVYYMVNGRDRYPALKRIADVNPEIYGIVFCRTRKETKDIAESLMTDGYNADALHGDLSQAQRDHVMNRFRTKHLQILVATDVAARGIDINDLTHIINYNLPDDNEAYIHRSGRTGRAGKKGISISIIRNREVDRIGSLEKKIGKKFEHKKVPGGQEICEKQLFKLIEKVDKIEVNNSQIEQYLPAVYEKLERLSREDLIKHFVSAEFNRFLTYYKNAPDLNVTSRKKDDRKKRNKIKYSRFFINLGVKDNLSVVNMIGLINDQTKSSDIEIGKIDIMKNFSFFETDSNFTDDILKSFENAQFNGSDIVVEMSNEKPKTRDNDRNRDRDRRGDNDRRGDKRNSKKKKKFSGRRFRD